MDRRDNWLERSSAELTRSSCMLSIGTWNFCSALNFALVAIHALNEQVRAIANHRALRRPGLARHFSNSCSRLKAAAGVLAGGGGRRLGSTHLAVREGGRGLRPQVFGWVAS